MEFIKTNIKIELPHQVRVVIECDELTDKLNALTSFIESNDLYKKLDSKEQKRLQRQLTFMELYWGVLIERINNF